MKRHFWSGISRDERFKAMSEITGIVDRYATILNFQRFSDISLGLLLETEEFKLNDLLMGLKNIMSVEGVDPNLSDSNADCIVHLHVTFTKGTGDLEIEVPNLPE